MASEIPEGVQSTVTDVAERMEHFTERARNGGSWIELQTWLLSMQPGLETLLEIGLAGIRGSARMRIAPERQEEIASSFTVPDSIPKDDCTCEWDPALCPRHRRNP
jgi:hypothetical protein